MTFKRPAYQTPYGSCLTATPGNAQNISLLGGESFEGVTFTQDQIARLQRFYGFEAPKRSATGGEAMVRAGDIRNLLRETRTDGLRLMAYLAHFLQKGEDPVVLVHNLCQQAGYDTGSTGMPFDEIADTDEDLTEDDPAFMGE